MVCAILHKKHYGPEVVHTAQGIQAVFQAGEEWDNARICPQESDVKLCVNIGSAGARRWRHHRK